ncbi:hypothetical protein Trydic_g11192 [Trypoxylus dichotomus]
MPEDRASRDGLLYLKEEELRSVLRHVPITDVYCVEDTVFARGKFATVRRALHKTTGVQYAAKHIKKRRRNVDMIPEIYHEISVLLKCSPNNRVVRLYEVYETNTDMVLILGLAAGGELQRIFDGDQCLGEIEARRAMRQILEGLCFLHERNIAHLDLKPQNILLMVEDSCDDIKLCDFGISRILEPGTEVRTLSGTPDYVAPEVVSYEPISLATDIWSVGVLAYVLLSGYTPFGADTKEQTSLNISKGIVTFEPEDFVDVSSVALDFIKSILVLNPKKRPTVQELLQHPWINPPSHILPSLSLMPSNDALNVTPKSTPINQRKLLPCLPETTAPSNNTTTATRTPFNSENLNGSDLVHVNVTNNSEALTNTSEVTTMPKPNSLVFENNEKNDIGSDLPKAGSSCRNSFFSQDGDTATPNDLSSEISSEEIEENFCLLKNIGKSTSREEFINSEAIYELENKDQTMKANEDNDTTNTITCLEKYWNNKDNNHISRSCEDLLSDSGIVSSLESDQNAFNEMSNDIEECAKKNEIYLCSPLAEQHEEKTEITINVGTVLKDSENNNVEEVPTDGFQKDDISKIRFKPSDTCSKNFKLEVGGIE